jgi:hypothetical protein
VCVNSTLEAEPWNGRQGVPVDRVVDNADARDLPRLLRARRERPRSRAAEQRDEQQPSGWSGERYVHSHQIFAADAGAHHGRTTTGSAAAGIG